MKTAYITDSIYLSHDTGANHPESRERLLSIQRHTQEICQEMVALEPIAVSRDILELVHTPEQVESIIEASSSSSPIDQDTICSTDSYHAATMAVGAGVVAIDAIVAGEIDRCFCAIRPPGHHATPTQPMGFCLFNNIAITARYAQSKGYERVMIIDFDVHHGNGTQDTFYEDSSVFYLSTHQAFVYPGTGAESHRGSGEGEGYTANYPLMPDSGDREILEVYRDDMPRDVARFAPDIILVSAGYDLHKSDPLAQMNVTTDGIREIVRAILDSVDVPFVFFLEGGYDVEALGENVRVTLEEMIGRAVES